MLFPSPSGIFNGIISRQKDEYECRFKRFRSQEHEAEIIEKVYGSDQSAAKDWKLGWGWGFKPCKKIVADDDDDDMKKKKKRKVDSKTMLADDDMKVDSKLGWELKPCETIVADDDDMKKKPKKKKQKKVDSSDMNVDLLPCNKPKPQKVKKGKKLKGGFRRFLSNNGRTKHLVRFQKGCYDKVDFDSLTGKYLIICCFEVPIFSDMELANQCRAVIEAYDHSPSFEIVLVLKMRSDADDYDQKAAFDHFCSAFSSCLAVPLSDVETRDYICSCFSSNICMGLDCAIMVDPNGLILEDEDTLYNFLYYGSEWLPPFLTEQEIVKQDHELRWRLDPINAVNGKVDDFDKMDRSYLSLYGDILLCNPHRTLRRFEESDDDVHTAAASTVLQLSTKYMGLQLQGN